MRRVGVGAATVVVLALTGCTADAPDIPDVPTSTTNAPEAKFPLAIQELSAKDGRIQTLNVQEDGVVLANGSKPGEQISCQLGAADLAVLKAAGVRVSDDDGSQTFDGPLTVTFEGVPVDDPRLAEAKPVIAGLVAELAGSESARKRCT
ncbi:hypothetical protein [Knoellia koreensis]|uniref:Lipoprotein n=1 Tax=Knoellia koreensis TaxID=2730921 RepID=A0A849HF00_9MICO|nr:hypothetical protein [Knoellia sp. DB2414S]NNM44791.1 hypothetical protein [Knoellia sp. DB2414S]